MKPAPFVFTLLLALAGTAASHGAPERLVSAAYSKPTDPWREYPTRLVSDLPGYTPTASDPLSRYGGLATDRRAATGFFRTEKIGDRWWLIDPEGCRFIHMGVVAVSYRDNTAPTADPAARAWASQAADLLHENGFNGAGAWSSTNLLRATPHPVAYTMIWNFMSEYGHRRGGIYQQAGHMGYPHDCIFVFDPEFAPFCDEYARRLAATKDDPWLLGHFSDNELPFYRRTLDNFLTLPPGDPGRKAVDAWLATRRAEHPAEASRTRCGTTSWATWSTGISRSPRRRFGSTIRIISVSGRASPGSH